MCALCDKGWRFEATDLHTGVVKAVLHPVRATWEEIYSTPSSGTLTLATRDPAADDIWPHTTGVYISRISADGTTRTGHFGGYVEKFSASSGGATEVGLQSIDEFLNHRLIANADEGVAYSTPEYVDPDHPGIGYPQTKVACDLVNLASPYGTVFYNGAGNGVPLFPILEDSAHTVVRSWEPWDFKNIGEAVQELVTAVNGVKYEITHLWFEGTGRWISHIRFFDEQNIDRNVVLRSDIEGWQYGLEVDAQNQASRVYGVGSGDGAVQQFSVAYDADAVLPEFQKTVAWKDIKVPATLDAQTRGEVMDNRDPVSNPTVTLAGLDTVPPERLHTGDIVTCDIGYGVATFRGQQARVISQSWELTEGQPVTRTLGLLPLVRPSLSVKTQTPAKEPPPETPEETDNPPPVTPIEPPPAPAPALPSQVLDLTNWKLTTAQGKPGSPTEIKQPALADYSEPTYFHVVQVNGENAVLFRAPQDGVTTSGSNNTREELREMRNNGKDNASWSSKSGTHTMEETIAFTHIEGPAGKPHVVGMQIHNASDDVTVLRREGTDIYVTKGNNTHYKKIITGYTEGLKLNMKVVADSDGIRWYRDNVEVASVSGTYSGCYFKTGAYQQAGHTGSDYGEVLIYSLTVTHS